jgi:hypothetical protein
VSKGYIAWRGPSLLTGDEIAVVIAAPEESRNAKTGPMAQVYIVPAKVHAGRAVGTSAERAVCGDCPLRGSGFGRADRICYVAWGVWVVGRHMAQGHYSEVPLAIASKDLAGKMVRIGAYGDPAAVPYDVWMELLKHQDTRWTGYTHQWRTCDQRLKHLCMASCEELQQSYEAHAMGWRTFRVRWSGGAVDLRERVCPSESRGLQCCDCMRCSGGLGFPNIVITAHGPGKGAFVWKYRQLKLL